MDLRRRDHSYAFLRRVARSRMGAVLNRVLPSSARRTLIALIDLPTVAIITTDLPSLHRFLFGGSGARSTDLIAVRLRFLSGLPVYLRPGTADVPVARNLAVKKPHLPPRSLLVSDARLIWDLGGNIGLTAFDYAIRWPSARVVVVELEPKNAELCRRNLNRFGERCEVVQAAVWPTDGQVALVARGIDGSELQTNSYTASESATGDRAIPAISLNTLLTRTAQGNAVDYCKMDVEGAEKSILREHTQWAKAVRTIGVEVHGDYTVEECQEDLTRLGFRVCQAREDNLVFATLIPPSPEASR